VGYLLMTFGGAVVEALLKVIKENDWKVGQIFLDNFYPKTLASFLLMILLEAVMLLTIQERWTDLIGSNWWQSIGVAFSLQSGAQKVLDILLADRFDDVEVRYMKWLARRRK